VKAQAKFDLYRQLPSVDDLLRQEQVSVLLAQSGHAAVTDAARAVLSRLRDEIAADLLDADALALALPGIPEAIERHLRGLLDYSIRPVINATGVVLHTNLGRAPLAASALQHIADTAGQYTNLEFDLESGERGKRDVHAGRLFNQLLGRPSELSTILVNNNAAAVLLALNSLAAGGEVIASRGELVEIGGSFRIPDVMSKSGATLREVGTTNRTRIEDYKAAIRENTRLLLRVHRSNFEISGFTEQPSLAELVDLSRRRQVPLLEDLGSGALVDLALHGVSGEPGVLDSLRLGVDVVTYSGDKLLGGPQAGILSGRADLISRMRANPLFRALRVDKLTYAALEATLLAYVRQDYAAIPALRMMDLTAVEIGARAQAIARGAASSNLSLEILDGESLVGGGAAPSAVLPTKLLAVTAKNLSADEIQLRLRRNVPPVIARVDDGRVVLDLRTVFPEQDDAITAALGQLTSLP
jgi:L-seryl-tRNA(Ser) seleniumtransferase